MNAGKRFEKCFTDSIDKSWKWDVARVPDPAQAFDMNNAQSVIRFSNKNPYDFNVYVRDLNMNLAIELKSTKSTSFSFQTLESKKGKMIKKHQIDGLTNADRNFRVAGFLFNIRKEDSDNTYWLDINNFNRFYDETSKLSINEKDIIEYGGVVVENRKLQVNYRYDILKLINKLYELRGEKWICQKQN